MTVSSGARTTLLQPEPAGQFLGSGMGESQRLVGARSAVMGLQRINRIESELGSSAGIAFHPVRLGR